MNESTKIPAEDIPPPPTLEEMWVNALNLTPEQLSETYGKFEGGPSSPIVALLLGAFEKIREARSLTEQYKQLAETDQLTGIGSRHALDAWVEGHYKPEINSYMAIYFDLERFKILNDTFGHGAGDAALAIFAAKLLQTFRFKPGKANDDKEKRRSFSDDYLIMRPGGDEFVVVLTIADDLDAEKISEIMETKIADRLAITSDDLEGHLGEGDGSDFVAVTPRYGFAFSDPDMTLEDLISEADIDMKSQASSR